MAHTPGPWAHESKKGPYNAEGTVSSMGVYSVAKFEALMDADSEANEDDVIDSAWVCGIWGPIDAEDEANARLIAAAPDLLEAAKYIKALIEQHYPNLVFNGHTKLLDGAISKATA